MKSQNLGMSIDLQNIMRFQLAPVPYSLGTADGHLAKTNKAKGFQYLTKHVKDVRPPLKEDTLLIMDGNALFHSMTEIPDTFRGISEKVFRMIPTQSDVIFSTDTYAKGSIKDMERERRGTGDIFLVSGASMRRPVDWKGFLSNSQNKEKLIAMLLEVWSDDSFADKLDDRKVRLFKSRFFIRIC